MATSPSFAASLVSMIPLLLVPIVYAGLLKLAAKLFRGARLAWRHAFIFGFLTFLVGLTFVLLEALGGMGFPSVPLGIAFGTGLQLALGGWYLGTRASTKVGEPLKFTRGALLTLAFMALTVAIGGIATVLLQGFRNGAAS